MAESVRFWTKSHHIWFSTDIMQKTWVLLDMGYTYFKPASTHQPIWNKPLPLHSSSHLPKPMHVLLPCNQERHMGKNRQHVERTAYSENQCVKKNTPQGLTCHRSKRLCLLRWCSYNTDPCEAIFVRCISCFCRLSEWIWSMKEDNKAST
jgi:hypothetical protein